MSCFRPSRRSPRRTMMSEIEGPDASQGACRAQARCTREYGEAIISLADRYLLPTIYPFSFFVTAGGLMNYPDLLRDTASYVDRIIEGATPDQLPVQLPTKFELMINLKAAKALGLSVPQSLLMAADKVVE
jgi:putative tryptophan/tyrosine transport system substrate-binding protein